MFGLENLLDAYRPQEKDITFRVKCKDLSVLFFDLKKFLSKTELTNTIEVNVANGIMTVRASAAAHYRFDIKLIEEKDGSHLKAELKNNYLFSDIEKMIPKAGAMQVTMTGTFLTLKNKTRSLRLASSMSELPNISFEREWTAFEDRRLVTSLRRLKELAPLSKIYRRSPPIQIGKTFLQELYQCIFVQAPSPDLEGLAIEPLQMQLLQDIILDYGIANSIDLDELSEEDLEEFDDLDDSAPIGNTTTCMYSEDESSLMFRFGDKYLGLTKTVGTSITDLNEELSAFTFVQEVDFGYLGAELKKLQQSAGNGEVTVFITTRSIIIEKQLLGNSFKLCIGDEDCNELVLQFTYALELLTPIIKYLGDSFEVYKKGELLCLKQGEYLIMISYRV